MIKLIDKLNSLGIYAKNESLNLIKQKKVKVNNEIITNPNDLIKDEDTIFVNNIRLPDLELKYFLINKPPNYLSNPNDKVKSNNVKHLLLDEHQLLGLQPIDTLSYKDQGIIILTNDQILLKKHQQLNLNIEYGFEVKLDKILRREDLKKIREGLKIEDTLFKPNYIKVTNVNPKTKTCTINLLFNNIKAHQIKQLFKYLDYKITLINRYKYDFLTNERLKLKTYRDLKVHEIKKLHRFIIK